MILNELNEFDRTGWILSTEMNWINSKEPDELKWHGWTQRIQMKRMHSNSPNELDKPDLET